MDYVFVEGKSLEQQIESWQIVSKAGIDMFEKHGFNHWYPPLTFKEYKKKLKNRFFFLCYQESIPVATFMISILDDSYSEPIWESVDKAIIVSKLATLPTYQSQGIGTKCLKFIETFALKNDRNRVLLDMFANHPKLEKFYKSNGYRLIAERTVITSRGNLWPIKQFEKCLTNNTKVRLQG